MLHEGETLKQHDRRIAREYRKALRDVQKIYAKQTTAKHEFVGLGNTICDVCGYTLNHANHN
jgi:hypothetical protein